MDDPKDGFALASVTRWPGERDIEEPVLRGAIDIHVHGYPDIGLNWRQRQDDLTMVRSAQAAGLGGIVLKSHFWPTMDRALILNSQAPAAGFTVYSSITLNPLIGGVQATTVEAAALHGAAMVFMPTWGSRNDHAHAGMVRRQIIDRELPSFASYLDRNAIQVVDDSGSLLPSARDVVRTCHEHALVLSTGHLSVAESRALAEYSARIGFTKLVLTHPLSPSIAASTTDLEAMAELGVLIELTAVVTMAPRPTVNAGTIFDTVERIGADNVILSSDTFVEWQPSQVDMLRMTIGQLRSLGMPDPTLRTLLVDNPRRLLGIAADTARRD